MAPRRLIVDDRNINWKNRKIFDPVLDQQFFELSQIPFGQKIEYAARYFKTHCHDCYCRDELVSPTSQYLFDEDENASAADDETSTCCTCPLDHPCTLKANDEGLIKNHKPFLQINLNDDEDGFMRRRGTSSSCDVDIAHSKNRKVIKSQEIVDCSNKCGYTKQREKYEMHNNRKTSSIVTKHKCNGRQNSSDVMATENTPPPLKEISNFRAQYFHDTHNPFQTTKQSSSTTNPIRHQCVYSFQLNSRLKPIPLNADMYGNSCCDICNKRMRTDSIKETTTNLNNAAEQEKGNSSSAHLESHKIHIGSGNERIKLAIQAGVLDESIGRSVDVASVGGNSKGQGKKATISWNNSSEGHVNPAERPNSFALRQQKFSMYSK